MPEETDGQEPEVEEPRTYDEAHVKKLNREAAGYRVERNELKKQVEGLTAEVKGFKDQSKSEVERITEEKAKLERDLADKDREMVEAAIKTEVMMEAAKLNIVDPGMAYLALDLSEIDAEDSASVSKALAKLVKDKPYLLKSEPPTPGAGGPPLQGKKSPSDMWVDVLKQGLKK